VQAEGNGAYDVLVIGIDDASRETALEAAKLGLRVVLLGEGHIHAGPELGQPVRPA
jgi:pyruvate/2-oxoglutarate dehydrogenase complex dihydrolipoamide dehydrogenase (E3) component